MSKFVTEARDVWQARAKAARAEAGTAARAEFKTIVTFATAAAAMIGLSGRGPFRIARKR
jgi:hypothetical protein